MNISTLGCMKNSLVPTFLIGTREDYQMKWSDLYAYKVVVSSETRKIVCQSEACETIKLKLQVKPSLHDLLVFHRVVTMCVDQVCQC